MTDEGLSTDQAAHALRVHGRNELPRPAPVRVWRRVAQQLRDPMILLLLAAAAVTTALRDVTDTVVIGAVILLNTAMGVVQEVRAERALAALEDMSAPTARVVRDGRVQVIPASVLVPGDLMHLEAGDIVPADALVLEVHELHLDESAMTGESVPVERVEGAEVQAGTVVTRGRAAATVTRTGSASALGQIAELVAAAPVRATPLQRRLSRLSRTLVVAAAVASAVVFVMGLVQGRSVGTMLVVAVSLAVAAVPESLPAVVSVALALGAYRMARRSAIVRRLPAVETLGSVSVLATDKTGTLTEGRMTASHVWTPEAAYSVSVDGGPALVRDDGASADPASTDPSSTELLRLLRAVVLCNDAQVVAVEGRSDLVGDPLETALLALAQAAGLDVATTRTAWPRLDEDPFDSRTRRMTTEHRSPDGADVVIVKGAPESVFVTLEPSPAVTQAENAAAALARSGRRVIAVAETAPDPADPELHPVNRLLGLVAISDPPRRTARDVIAACRDAGVRVVMITGDHADTARAIAMDLELTVDAPVVLVGDGSEGGHEADNGQAAWAEPAAEVNVYARTRPEQKVNIVRSLQAAGHVVAMTGDGVNDAPALRAADIGVAMGRGGTEVARQASALVLADDDLGTVVAAIEEGRRILANIRAFLRYALSGGFAEVLVMIVAPFIGMPIPLLPGQILWINMLTHGPPGVAFGAEPVDPAVMKQPSRHPEESVLGDGLGVQILVLGSVIAAVALAAGLAADASGQPVQSHVFLVLGLAQLGVAMALRNPRPGRTWRGRSLEAAVAVSAVLLLAALYVPALQDLLHTAPVAARALVPLFLLSMVPGLFARLVRRRALAGTSTGRKGPLRKDVGLS